MIREVTDSLDARKLYDETRRNLNKDWGRVLSQSHAYELEKLLINISSMIDDLNKMEVYARRAGKRSQYHKNCLNLSKQINEAFLFYDKMVFFAKIMA